MKNKVAIPAFAAVFVLGAVVSLSGDTQGNKNTSLLERIVTLERRLEEVQPMDGCRMEFGVIEPSQLRLRDSVHEKKTNALAQVKFSRAFSTIPAIFVCRNKGNVDAKQSSSMVPIYQDLTNQGLYTTTRTYKDGFVATFDVEGKGER